MHKINLGQKGPCWPKEIYFGPSASADSTVASPEQLTDRPNNFSSLRCSCNMHHNPNASLITDRRMQALTLQCSCLAIGRDSVSANSLSPGELVFPPDKIC